MVHIAVVSPLSAHRALLKRRFGMLSWGFIFKNFTSWVGGFFKGGLIQRAAMQGFTVLSFSSRLFRTWTMRFSNMIFSSVIDKRFYFWQILLSFHFNMQSN